MNGKIGPQLRQAREARELTLEQVAKATHMRVHYLEAMEAEAFERIPSLAQTRGFLRSYAGFLNIPAEPLLKSLEALTPAQAASTLPVPPARQEKIPVVSEEADAIFGEVGRQLEHQRELLGLSLEDVERHTHLRKHYLQALESGDMQSLPSPVQARGMLSNYAEFLSLDPDPLLLHFAEGLQARLVAAKVAESKEQEQGRPASKRSKPALHPIHLPPALHRILSGDLLIGGLLALFLVGFMTWGAIRVFSMRAEVTPSPTAPSIADVLLVDPSETPTPTPEPATPTLPAPADVVDTTGTPDGEATPEVTLPASDGQPVQIYVTVHQRAWMQVTVDGEVEFEGRVIPGNAYSFTGKETVQVITGNAGALQIFYNQQDKGPMGLYGQIANRVYTQEGILAPTATITPTATLTPRITSTPQPSTTPRPGMATAPALP